jgi:hypothetical protein
MSDNIDELFKILKLYESGAITEAEMKRLKSSVLGIEYNGPNNEKTKTKIPKENKENESIQSEITSVPKQKEEIYTGTAKEIFEEEPEKTTEKVTSSLEKVNTTKEFNVKNDTIQKLDALLKAGKISEKEHQILVDKILNINSNITPPSLKNDINKNVDTPLDPSKKIEITQVTSEPKVVLTPIVKVEETQKVKLVPETEIKKETTQGGTKEVLVQSVYTNDKKKKSQSLLFILLGIVLVTGLILILFVNGVFDSGNTISTTTGSANGVTYDTKYVMSGSLNLMEEPNEESEVVHTFKFGDKIELIQNSEKIVDDFSYMKVKYNGTIGWVSVKFKDKTLVADIEDIESIKKIVTGKYAQDILEDMGATPKYALLEICNEDDRIEVTSLEYPLIQFLRSRIDNRNSSSDEKKEINNFPKDMIFCVNKSSGDQMFYFIYFDSDYNYSIEIESPNNSQLINGFKRIKRGEVISFYTDENFYSEQKLEHDAIEILFDNYTVKYFYPYFSSNILYTKYESY